MSSTLFTSDVPLNEDVLRLFAQSPLPSNKDNLFSEVNITALSSQVTSHPVTLLPASQDVPASTLFGAFSEDVRSPSPASSLLSLTREEITEHTIHEDIWHDADSLSPTAKIYTWESFGAGRAGVDVRGSAFVTEQSQRVFDLTLQRHMNHLYAPDETGTVVDEKLFREVTGV
jgi:hypothetical protein